MCTVASLDVLESCQFQSKIAFPHTLNKQYEGVYTVSPSLYTHSPPLCVCVQVRESQVFPPDPTVFQHWRKQDKGNRFMTQEVGHTHFTSLSDSAHLVCDQRSEQILQLYKKLFTEKGYRSVTTHTHTLTHSLTHCVQRRSEDKQDGRDR